MSYAKSMALLCALAAVAASLAGCPFSAPDVQNALLVKPETLDFGTDQVQLTFNVAKVWSSRSIPPFVVTPSASWISVSPTGGGTTAPWDRATITVTIDRSKLTSFQNQANVTVSAGNVVPVSVRILARQVLLADFSADKVLVGFNTPVQFTDQSTTASPLEFPITSWLWDFGDGTTSSDRNPQHTYTAEGTYSVSLTVGDGTHTHTATKVDYIVLRDIVPPVPDFSASTQRAVTGQQVQFTNLTTASPTNPVTVWQWDFGDGSQGVNRAQQNPVHIYNAVGVYTVSLTVTAGPYLETVTKTEFIHVAQVDFTADKTSITANETVQFTDISVVPNETINNWAWDFGDGNTGTGPVSNHLYAAAAAMYTYYPVSMNIQTDQSSSYDKVKPNYILLYTPGAPAKAGAASEPMTTPVASFRLVYPWDASFKWFVTGQEVPFESDSDIGGTGLVSYAWDFGDGSSSPARNPFHIYREASADGAYAVSLKVTNSAGSDQMVCPDALHVFEAGPLDVYAQRFDPRYVREPQVTGTMEVAGAIVTQAEVISQMADDSAEALPLTHQLTIVKPSQVTQSAVLLLLDDAEGATADQGLLVQAALATGQTLAVLHRAPGQPASGAMAVRAAVSAMNALDSLDIATGGGYVVAGSGWTALLTAGVDPRVCAVITSGMNADAPADVADPALYTARVKIPVQSASAVLEGIEGFPVVVNAELTARYMAE